MRHLAIENCAKLMAIAHEQKNEQALDQYCNKLRILTDRSAHSDRSASVIRELVNQTVEY